MYKQQTPAFQSGVYIPEKTIPFPISGRIDVSNVLPLIEHPYVQRLRYRRQLSFLDLVRPGGTHVRFEHVVAGLGLLRAMVSRLQITDPVLAQALEVYYLLHDIGHGPFSHESEPVLGEDHNVIGWQLLREMREEIAQIADFSLVEQLFLHQHLASCLVHDRNFGADKLDYLARDAYHTGYELGLNVHNILSYLIFDGQTLGVEEKMKEEVIRVQLSYLSMYTRLYLHKTGKIAARMYQRALQDYLRGQPEHLSGWWDLTDAEAEARLIHSPLMQALHQRRLPKTVCVLKMKGYEDEERVGDRGYPVFGLSLARIRMQSRMFENPENLLQFEQRLEEMVGLQPGDVIVSQTGRYDKLVPVDALLYCLAEKHFTSLFQRVPSHVANLSEIADRAFAIRIAVQPERIPAFSSFVWEDFLTKHLS